MPSLGGETKLAVAICANAHPRTVMNMIPRHTEYSEGFKGPGDQAMCKQKERYGREAAKIRLHNGSSRISGYFASTNMRSCKVVAVPGQASIIYV